MIFSIKDSLRQAVEAASGGLNTVVYTRKGQPVFLRRIPKFRVETLHPSLGTGVHPAFIVGGREVSEIWIGMYPALLSNGELISVPGVAPSFMTLNTAVNAARANGPGFHVITNAEWAAMALLSIHSIGNNDDPTSSPNGFGVDVKNPRLFGVRVDGRAPGEPIASLTLTGSGPLSWRHDLSPFGVADVGVGHIVAGLLLRRGEINIIPNNDAAMSSINLSQDSQAWRAILPDGTLVSPGASNTLTFDIPPNAMYMGRGNIIGPTYLKTNTIPPPFDSNSNQHFDTTYNPWKDTGKDPSTLNVPPLLHSLLLFPHVPVSRGLTRVAPYGERVAMRGDGGLTSIFFLDPPSFAGVTRVAYLV